MGPLTRDLPRHGAWDTGSQSCLGFYEGCGVICVSAEPATVLPACVVSRGLPCSNSETPFSQVVDRDSEEAKIIRKYVKNTHATTHNAYDLKVIDVRLCFSSVPFCPVSSSCSFLRPG